MARGERLDHDGNWRGPPMPFFDDVLHTIDELIALKRDQAEQIEALRREAREAGPGDGAGSVSGGSYGEAVRRHGGLSPWP